MVWGFCKRWQRGEEGIGNKGKGAVRYGAITECHRSASLIMVVHAPPFPGWAGALRRASIESTHASRRDLPLTPTAVRNLRVDKFKPLIP